MSGEIQVRPASHSDRQAWNAYVADRSDASVVHLFEWAAVFSDAYGKRCPYLYATAGREWLGVLPLVHMRGPLTGNRLVSLPFLDQGGILSETVEARRALWDAALRLARRLSARGVDLRGPGPGSERPAAPPTRFRFLLRLEGSEEELWRAIGPKVRNQIRKSEREGLETRAAAPSELPAFYSVFARNMRDLGSPVHSRRFFEKLCLALSDRATVYLTSDRSGRPVGGAIALRFGATASVPWASSLRSARPSCPNHSLYWRILREARERGATLFDFGRSSVGGGTFHFKKQWRGEAVPLHWSSFDRDGAAASDRTLDPLERRRLAGAWRRVPLAIANRLGPLIRRQLAN